jgi:protease I
MFLAAWLYGLTVAILVTTGFEQSEMVGPEKALEEAGAVVHIVAPVEGTVQGWDWMVMQPKDNFNVDVTLKSANPIDYDALVLPGGLSSPDDLRLDDHAVAFVKSFQSKPIAAICHGPWLLINAELVKNKKVTSWPSIKIDLTNAGANWVDQEVVRDGNLITSRSPDDVPAFNHVMLEAFSEALAKKKA